MIGKKNKIIIIIIIWMILCIFLVLHSFLSRSYIELKTAFNFNLLIILYSSNLTEAHPRFI